MTTTTARTPASKTASKPASSGKTPVKTKASAAKSMSTSTSVRPKAATAAPPETNVVEGQQPVVAGPQMRKKELVDAVVAQTGMKKKNVKPVVEATLAILGAALGDNRELNLQPFGHLKVRKERELANGRMVVAKVRQTQPNPDAAEASAAAKPEAETAL